MKKPAWILLSMCMFSALAADTTGGHKLLSEDAFTAWSTRIFDGETNYEFVRDSAGGFVRATSDAAASARYRKQVIDLTQTPWLSWRWRIVRPIAPQNERSKNGDDYAARVYVVYASSFWPGSVRSLNYVWSHQEPVGEHWPNPFTDKAMMIPLRQGGAAGEWQFERRNIVEDFHTFFGIDVSELKGVAIMTDTDNSGLSAIADYADMQFDSRMPALIR